MAPQSRSGPPRPKGKDLRSYQAHPPRFKLPPAKSIAFAHWGNHGLIEVGAHASGFFFFKFKDATTRDLALEAGPWYFGGGLAILKKWSRGLSIERELVKEVPVWVKIHNLPIEHWNSASLSVIGSFLGTPVLIDSPTLSKSNVSFARICIQVGLQDPVEKEVTALLEDEFGLPVEHKLCVEYQNLPPRCQKCGTFGHFCLSKSRPITKTPPNLAKPNMEWQTVGKNGKSVVQNSPQTSRAEVLITKIIVNEEVESPNPFGVLDEVEANFDFNYVQKSGNKIVTPLQSPAGPSGVVKHAEKKVQTASPKRASPPKQQQRVVVTHELITTPNQKGKEKEGEQILQTKEKGNSLSSPIKYKENILPDSPLPICVENSPQATPTAKLLVRPSSSPSTRSSKFFVHPDDLQEEEEEDQLSESKKKSGKGGSKSKRELKADRRSARIASKSQSYQSESA